VIYLCIILFGPILVVLSIVSMFYIIRLRLYLWMNNREILRILDETDDGTVLGIYRSYFRAKEWFYSDISTSDVTIDNFRRYLIIVRRYSFMIFKIMLLLLIPSLIIFILTN